jgi:ABC-type Co2+ transport system permease subunit
VGGVLEARRWAFASEQARLVALTAAFAVMAVRVPAHWGTVGAVVCLASLAMLWRWRAAFTGESDERMDRDHAGAGRT